MKYLKIVCSGPYINSDSPYHYEVDDDFDENAPENKKFIEECYLESISAYCENSYVVGLVDSKED